MNARIADISHYQEKVDWAKAREAQDARTEARWFVECAHRARARPTIYFADIEFSAQTKATTETVCVAFLEELRALGCPRVGLYIGQSRYKYAGKAIAMCDAIWIPRYGENDGSVPPEKYYPKYPLRPVAVHQPRPHRRHHRQGGP